LLYLFNLDSYEYEVHLVEKNNGKIKWNNSRRFL
jgi:hypothetical protein